MISVIILTKNEESRIKTCLESVKWADEIIVADHGSTDKTLKIVKKYTDKIITFVEEDFAKWRNKAAEETSGNWLLYVDPDERVVELLKEEIKKLIETDEFSAYAISRRNIIFGSEVKYDPFWPDWVIRLIKRDALEGWIGRVHEYPKFTGKLGYTKNSLLHLTHRGVDQIVLKSLEWSKIDAKLRLEAGHPKMSAWRFLRIFTTEIFNQGILRKGFFNGTIGIMDSILQAFSMYMTYVQLWQLQQKKLMEEVYNNIDEELLKNKFNY
ncbi:MAG: Glycosyl transferase family 2 [Microgenomates group bacterium Gr01-1014_7]|nr:MAG: Glycosyl transferase family 2 [Microgenomates group bacterium Gr01-1014_7]